MRPLPAFVLASASPARRKLLEQAGIVPIVCPSDFDEAVLRSEDPAYLVEFLARGKAATVAPQFADRPALVMGCDSVLVLHGQIYGKPSDPAAAIAMWQQMRGQQGAIYTGHCLIETATGRALERHGVSQVFFANATDREIAGYIETGEPLRCAGCFALEGMGGWLVEKIDGCHTNVLGLSLPLLRAMLRDLGYGLQFSATGVAIVPEPDSIP